MDLSVDTMNTSSKQNLENLLKGAKKDTSWKKKAENELANEAWLQKSSAIALFILEMSYMRTPQSQNNYSLDI